MFSQSILWQSDPTLGIQPAWGRDAQRSCRSPHKPLSHRAQSASNVGINGGTRVWELWQRSVVWGIEDHGCAWIDWECKGSGFCDWFSGEGMLWCWCLELVRVLSRWDWLESLCRGGLDQVWSEIDVFGGDLDRSEWFWTEICLIGWAWTIMTEHRRPSKQVFCFTIQGLDQTRRFGNFSHSFGGKLISVTNYFFERFFSGNNVKFS
jgi:hypothetical protein